MDTPIIEVANISKKYTLLPEQVRNGYTLKEFIGDALRKITGQAHRTTQALWALEDISFTVEKGEIIGILGPNGAGKSTLLKLLSNVTEPTTGTIRINGNITSLLEIGSGFHPDLTGRENVFFSGAIIGISQKSIEKRFKEIVSFADVWQFIDVPVKYYSAGMAARLSFAVALFLQPEILIIDEALMVGDAEFQKKCLRHFSQLATSGVTIIITSHDMSLIKKMATRCLYIDQGKIKMIGKPSDIIQQYLHGGNRKPL